MSPRRLGFSLLEVLIAVTIISAIATIAIPNLIRAIDRGRQSSTMADMRTIGSALERYAVDHLTYPRRSDFETVRPELEPEYVKRVPTRDAWGHPFIFDVDEHGTSYVLRSPGKDGEPEGQAPDGPRREASADIVMIDGVFVQWPAGTKDEPQEESEPQEPGEAEPPAT